MTIARGGERIRFKRETSPNGGRVVLPPERKTVLRNLLAPMAGR
jgi:hypothetical protein